MKRISRSIHKLDGEWWYVGPRGIRQRARIKSCETCGSQFASYPVGRTRFCSVKCWRRPCIRCGSIFKPNTRRNVYCSEQCKRGNAVCEGCRKSFIPGKKTARRFCSRRCFYDGMCPVGTVAHSYAGYMIIKVPPDTPGRKLAGNRGNWMWEHRYVMQQKLKRPLLRTERVHHINGKRNDNRPENLELWKRAHPPGVRSKDYHCAGCRCFEGKS